MTKKTPKTTVVAFKVEEELANFLDQLPNKSDFIRRAIYSQLGIACPLCRGTGSVTKETHDHFANFLEKWELHQCDSCGDEYAMPKEVTEAVGDLRGHVAQTMAGGPGYCYTCFSHTAKPKRS
ncbi:MAG: hypothetical protein ACRDD1_20385 [Planctomycetia bacterium]